MLKSVTARSIIAAVACAISMSAYAIANAPKDINVPAGDLIAALESLSKQISLELLFQPSQLRAFHTGGVHGSYTPEAAVRLLIKDTPLQLRTDPVSGAMVIASPHSQPSARINTEMTPNGEGKGIDSGFFLLAPAVQGQTAAPAASVGAQPLASSELGTELQEVLVTAQRKDEAERLQDVPIPMSVIRSESLMQNNLARIQDYFDQVPGLMVAQGTGAASAVAIRGITTGQNNNPTVGFTLDDVPLGGSTNSGAASQVPFINPADIAQVEVLRGPQGTLYGDNSMGGLIRYVTVDPSTDRVFGDVRVGGDSVRNGVNLGYNLSAAVNVPITDTLAIRASGFTRQDPGFVDDVETGQRGVNTAHATGARIAVKWAPSSNFSLKLSALDEKFHLEADPGIDVPTPGYPYTTDLVDLQQYSSRAAGYDIEEWKSLNLTLNGIIAGVKVTSITGYSVNGYTSSQDATYAIAGSIPPLFPPGLAAPLEYTNSIHKFTQEVRLSERLGSQLEWLLGAFYTQEDNVDSDIWSAADPISGVMVGAPGSVLFAGGPHRFREYAGFGSLTWKIVDQFDVQFGVRESYMETPALAQGSYTGGSIFGEPPGPSTYTPPDSSYWKDNAFTYLVSPRFKLSPDVMVYARVANGFRPGYGVSNPPPTASCVQLAEPCQINSDKITNYEVGMKADFFNHVLSVDSSVYYIDWKDLQVNLTRGPLNYGGNGAGAKSQGVDLALEWKPLPGLTLSGWAAWDEAVTTESFSNAIAGDRLPYSARFSANLTAKQEFLITGDVHGFAEGKEIYMGNRIGEFTSIGAPRQYYPPYAQTDVDAGIKVSSWTFNVYVNNLTDRRGAVYGGIGGAAPFEFNYINPRTIGIGFERTF